jgi:GxxExxY protein
LFQTEGIVGLTTTGLVMNVQDARARREVLDRLCHRVIGFCLEVHRELGPGLLESAYEEALAFELAQDGMECERQREIPLLYKTNPLNCGYRIDLLVDSELIVELKAANELLPVHYAQVMTYLRLSNRSLGLLVNFNVPRLKDGVHRVVVGDLYQND